jgi:hypothetical protein
VVEPAPSRSSAALRERSLRAILIVAYLLPTLPAPGLPIAPGIDNSYVWALNALAAGQAEPAPATAFPYGPLGFLAAPQPVADRIAAAVPVRLALHLLAALALWRFGELAGSRRLAGFLVLLLLVGAIFSLTWESTVALLVPLLLAPDLAGSRSVPVAPALAGALIPLFLLIKLSLAVGVAAFVAAWAVARLLTASGPGRRDVVACAASLAVALAVAIGAGFGSLPTFADWVGGQLQLAAGYSTAMSLEGSPLAIAAGSALLAMPLALALSARHAGDANSNLYLAMAVPSWLAFRHGFVRPDLHVAVGVAPMVGMLATALPLARGARSVARALVGVAAAAVLAVIAVAATGEVDLRALRARFDGRVAMANLRGTLDPGRHAARLRAVGNRLLAGERFGPNQGDADAARAPTYDAVPWNLAALPANGLRWRPNPLLQLYHAWTPELDRRAARHFTSSAGADFLLVHPDTIDGRQLLWEAPETWRAIEGAYRLASRPAPRGWCLLERRPQPAERRSRALGVAELAHGEWLEVPRAERGAALHAALRLEPDLGGRISAALFRIGPVELEVELADGTSRAWRLVPGVAASGLRLDGLVEDTADLERLFAATPATAPAGAVRIRATGSGLGAYRSPIRLEWSEERLIVP